MQIQLNPSRLTLAIMLASLTGLIGVLPAEAAPAKLRLTKSQWTASKQTLSIAGKLSNATTGASVELYGLDGRLLGTPTLSNKGVFSLTLNKDQLPDIPCSIRAKSGDIDVFKSVTGSPKSCLKAPQCSITLPLEGAELTVNQATNFKATVTLSDKKPLSPAMNGILLAVPCRKKLSANPAQRLQPLSFEITASIASVISPQTAKAAAVKMP